MLTGLLEIVLLAGLVWGAPRLGIWWAKRWARRYPARGRHHAGAPVVPEPEVPAEPELTGCRRKMLEDFRLLSGPVSRVYGRALADALREDNLDVTDAQLTNLLADIVKYFDRNLEEIEGDPEMQLAATFEVLAAAAVDTSETAKLNFQSFT
jgi:hypothetical protein